MPVITYEQSCAEIDALLRQAHDAQRALDPSAAIAAFERLLDHPCAPHQAHAHELWEELHQQHRQAREYDAAIAAKRRAIELGYASEPDPEADIAECHLLAGRREEADRLFAVLRERAPEDVWLYNSAGYAYADDPATAATWFRDGVELALATGDPEGIVMQLLEGLEAAQDALGGPRDTELTARVASFAKRWKPPSGRRRPSWPEPPPAEPVQTCAHCGFDPARRPAEMDERRWRALAEAWAEGPAVLSGTTGDAPPLITGAGPPPPLSVGWFPAGEWEAATAAWPELLDELPAEHARYCQRIEARTKAAATRVLGHQMHLVELDVEGLAAHAEEEDLDPASGEARAGYGALRTEQGLATPWPPARNAPCWCGSGRKYKRCCGPVPADPAATG